MKSAVLRFTDAGGAEVTTEFAFSDNTEDPNSPAHVIASWIADNLNEVMDRAAIAHARKATERAAATAAQEAHNADAEVDFVEPAPKLLDSNGAVLQ